MDVMFERIIPFANNEILVGGHSIAYWCHAYGLPPAVTRDMAFIGGAIDAKALAKRLGGTAHIPTLGRHTPNTAVVWVENLLNPEEEHYFIDYMDRVYGVDKNRLLKRAMEVSYAGNTFRIMHPIDCMASKINNLARLPSKRKKSDIHQARMTVDIARCYILAHIAKAERSGEIPDRAVLNAAEEVINIATSQAGKEVFRQYGIDVLKAIPLPHMPKRFFEMRYPRVLAEVDAKRARHARNIIEAERRAAAVKDSHPVYTSA